MNAFNLIQGAVNRWRSGEGANTLAYGYCQRFDGWYVSREYQNNKNIRPYASAQRAAEASKIFTKNPNDPAIRPGDSLYYTYARDGHIVTAMGWDGGRLIVSNTAHTGDNLHDFGNGVKISHADSLALPFIGASHQNGTNQERAGVEAYNINTNAPASGGGSTPAPAGQNILNCPSTGIYWYTSPGNAQAMQGVHGHPYTNEKLLTGQYDQISRESNGALRVPANDGSIVYIHSSMEKYVTWGAGTPAPAPAPTHRYVHLDQNWYGYNSEGEALNAQNKWKWIPPGEHRIDGGSGPYDVYVGALGRNAWVGSRYTNPPVITK